MYDKGGGVQVAVVLYPGFTALDTRQWRAVNTVLAALLVASIIPMWFE